ncbi:MAG: transglycosylase SLT domain-containing protein [bacterium]
MRRYWVPLLCLTVLFISQPVTAGIYLKISDTGVFSLSNQPSEKGFRLIVGSKSKEEISKIDQAVDEASGRFGLPKSLIFSIIRNSRNRPGGIMGLPEPLLLKLSDTAVSNPRKNIIAGSRHLADLFFVFDGNLSLTLGAYFSGKEAVRKADGLPSERVREWVNSVQDSFRTFEDRNEIFFRYKNDDGVMTIINIRP